MAPIKYRNNTLTRGIRYWRLYRAAKAGSKAASGLQENATKYDAELIAPRKPKGTPSRVGTGGKSTSKFRQKKLGVIQAAVEEYVDSVSIEEPIDNDNLDQLARRFKKVLPPCPSPQNTQAMRGGRGR